MSYRHLLNFLFMFSTFIFVVNSFDGKHLLAYTALEVSRHFDVKTRW